MAETSGTTTIVRRGDARRSEVMDALVSLLLADGFAHLTLDSIAARLHCSKRTLYVLAKSKEQLVRAAVVHFFRRATELVERATAAQTAPARRLATYLEAVEAQLAPASSRFFNDVAAFPPAAEVYERNTRAAAGRIQELIEEGVTAGVFRRVHIPFAADLVASVMVRIQQRHVANATGLADADAYQQLTSLLLRGIAATPA